MTYIQPNITGDPETDAYIVQKVREDYARPPTDFHGKRVETGEPITDFSGPYAFLSNDFPCEIFAGGQVFQSVQEALDYAEPNFGTVEWELSARDQVMRVLLDQKFSSHEYLLFHLLGTGHRPLEYSNELGDGVCGTDRRDKLHPLVSDIMETVYNGENRLGKMLMEVRHECRLRLTGSVRFFE